MVKRHLLTQKLASLFLAPALITLSGHCSLAGKCSDTAAPKTPVTIDFKVIAVPIPIKVRTDIGFFDFVYVNPEKVTHELQPANGESITLASPILSLRDAIGIKTIADWQKSYSIDNTFHLNGVGPKIMGGWIYAKGNGASFRIKPTGRGDSHSDFDLSSASPKGFLKLMQRVRIFQHSKVIMKVDFQDNLMTISTAPPVHPVDYNDSPLKIFQFQTDEPIQKIEIYPDSENRLILEISTGAKSTFIDITGLQAPTFRVYNGLFPRD